MKFYVTTVLVCFIASVYCQNNAEINNPTFIEETNPVLFKSDALSSEMSIVGTSTLHDWESDVESFTASAKRIGNTIQANLEVEVLSIKSGKKVMDSNTYKALKANEFPTISLSASDLDIKENHKITGSGYLTIAGVKKVIPISIFMETWAQNSMTIIGEIPLKMTDYNVDPPIALFGTVKTGNEITIKFNITLISL